MLLLFASCSKDSDPVVTNYLVEAKQKPDATKSVLQSALTVFGYGQYASLPQTDVTPYAVTYRTQYPQNKAMQASGVFFVPKNLNKSFPVVVYAHGTIGKDETPSQQVESVLNYSLDLFFAAVISSGYNCVVLVPDYVGYGQSTSVTHPYIHQQSLGQAGVDMVEAFREYTAGVGLPFNPRTIITGYSEGGYTAVAVQKAIQELYGSDLSVDKTIAGSGPYDNVAFAKEFMRKSTDLDKYEVSSYLWALGMFKTDYGYSKSYSAIFSDSDNAKLQAAGYQLGYFEPAKLDIHTNPQQLFKPEFISSVLNGTDTEFLNVLTQNSLVDFAPADSLVFVYGNADTWVYPVNTINAYNTMKNKGCKVKKYESPNGTHSTTIYLFLDVLLGSLNEVKMRN